jgi:integrase/recombinase XerD
MLTIRKSPERPVDRRGFYRSPVTLPEYRRGRAPLNKGRKFPAEPLTSAEVYALMGACGRGPAGRRNRAMIVVMWRCGLRCGEMLALMPKDVNLEAGRIAVLHGKGDKRRVVAIDPDAAAVLERWEAERRGLGVGGRDPYFCVISQPTLGRPVNDAYVRELLKKLAVKAGIDKRVHPHGLRHTYASFLMDQGVPIHHIRRMLGHTSISITERYVDHLNPSEVLETMRRVQWPGQGEPARPAAGPEWREPSPGGRIRYVT